MRPSKLWFAPLTLAATLTAAPAPADSKAGTQGAATKKDAIDPQAVESKFRKFYDEVVNTQKYDRLTEYVTPGFKEHDPMPGAKATQGPEVVRETYEMLFTAFPDGKLSVDDVIVQGDKAVARYTFTGTQKGTFMNQPASNKKVKVTGFDWIKVNQDLKATAHWGFMDAAALMQQIGGKQQARVE